MKEFLATIGLFLNGFTIVYGMVDNDWMEYRDCGRSGFGSTH